MKKELSIFKKNIELSFFYSEDLVSESELQDYEENLSRLCICFDTFLKDSEKLFKDLFVINLNISTNPEIRDINFEYRNKNKVTDVLSFPMQENLRNGHYDEIIPEIELGDIFISKSVCEEQAREFNLSYMEEFVHLVTHGFLHLCGYDHEISDKEEKLMEANEESILNKFTKLKISS